MEPPLTFGEWLLRRRKALGLTREQLAQRVGYSVSALLKLETGERRPSGQVAELLAHGLQLPPEVRPTFLRVAHGELSIERVPALGSLPPAPPQTSRVYLPVNVTPLIGRQREQEELRRLLADPACRLLTLLGPGGVG